MSLLILSGSTSPVRTVGVRSRSALTREASLSESACRRRAGRPARGLRRGAGGAAGGARGGGACAGRAAAGGRGFDGAGAAGPVRAGGGLPQARGASLRRGPRARFVP